MNSGNQIHVSLMFPQYTVIPPTETRYVTGTMSYALNSVVGLPPRAQGGCSIRMRNRCGCFGEQRLEEYRDGAWLLHSPCIPYTAERICEAAWRITNRARRCQVAAEINRRVPGVSVVVAPSRDREPDTCPTPIPGTCIARIRAVPAP
jgi:hypothetical protein